MSEVILIFFWHETDFNNGLKISFNKYREKKNPQISTKLLIF